MTTGEMTDGEYAQEREHWEASARTIIECGNVLEWFVGSWRKIVAGEEQNAKLLYLVATSRLFGKCMNASIKGPSSAGKSEIRRQVLEFFPPEEVVSFTTLSEKALLYYDGDFAHKILSMGEASGVDRLEDVLMPLLDRCHRMMARSLASLETRRPRASCSPQVAIAQADQVNVDCAVMSQGARAEKTRGTYAND